MNYENPELLDRLAAEYVVGTLSPLAQRRFERLVRGSDDAQQAVWRWERDLAPIAEALPAETPDERVWQNIEAEIAPRPKRRFGLPLLGFAGGVLATLLVAALLLPRLSEPPGFSPTHVAQIAGDEGLLWVVSADAQLDQVRLTPAGIEAVPDKDFELWLLPEGGQPVSLGLLPVAEVRLRTWSPQADSAFPASPAVAVSLEPLGGSTTGLPTGPVLYSAPLVSL